VAGAAVDEVARASDVRGDDPRLGEIGYTLARDQQGHGYATEAVRALLDYAFATLTLHRVTASADCRNTPSFKLLERVGMRREGQFLQHAWYKGEWRQERLHAMLRSDCWRGQGAPASRCVIARACREANVIPRPRSVMGS
jgi:RimJ/RimL family protein N-acetyltransferase